MLGVLNVCYFRISQLQKEGLMDAYEESVHVHEEGEFLTFYLPPFGVFWLPLPLKRWFYDRECSGFHKT